MKVLLMYKDKDFGLKDDIAANSSDLIRDLELTTLFGAGDEFLVEVINQAFLASLRDRDAILYRQHVLADCLKHSDIVRDIYAISVEALEKERKVWRVFGSYPEAVLRRGIGVLEIFVPLLRRLREIADRYADGFQSEGFRRFFEMLRGELNDEYLAVVKDHLDRLQFRKGILMTAQFGKGLKGSRHVLLKTKETDETWFRRLRSWVEERFSSKEPSSYFYEIADRDEGGFRALSELRGRGIANVAIAVAHSTDHIVSFFSALRLELGFYIWCLDLRDNLARQGEPICFPEPVPEGEIAFSARGLYDVCLSLTLRAPVTRNDVDGDGKMLTIVTGANRGGKSTLLRSVGLGQLMMQCGMFVPAEFFRANVCDAVFTHFKREEDTSMKSGKLDEELARMSSIVDRIAPGSLILFNESFASTNEREGSEIARQIVRALLEGGVKVFYVTHMYDLAHGFYREATESALYLRAERLADGRRTFRLVEGEPQPTSYGEDLYHRIFSEDTKVSEAVHGENEA